MKKFIFSLLLMVIGSVILKAQNTPRLEFPVGHSGGVFCAEFSPDGRFIASSGSDKLIRIWDAKSGRFLLTLESVRSFYPPYNDLVFSPDGTNLMAECGKKTFLWKVNSGKLLKELTGNSSEYDSIWRIQNIRRPVFSPDGKLVLIGSKSDYSIPIIEAKTGKIVKSFRGHKRSIKSATFSSDGKFLLTYEDSLTCILWNSVTGKKVRNMGYYTTFGSEENSLLTILKDKILVTELTSGKTRKEIIIRADSNNFSEINSDGSRFTCIVGSDSLSFWNLQNGNLIQKIKLESGCWPDGFGNNRKYFVTKTKAHNSDDFNILNLWDTDSGIMKSLSGHSGRIYQQAFSKDGSSLVSSSPIDNTIRIWDTKSGKAEHILQSELVFLKACIFNESSIITSGRDSTIRLLDLASGKQLFQVKMDSKLIGSPVLSKDRKLLLVTLCDNSAAILDAENLKVLHKLNGHKEKIVSAEFSSDGKKVVTMDARFRDGTAPKYNTVRIWDSSTGNQILEIPQTGVFDSNHQGQFSQPFIKISPDNKLVYTFSRNDSLHRIWDISSGSIINSISSKIFKTDSYGGFINQSVFNFSPEGQRILISDGDSLRVFNSATFALELKLPGRAIDFSPDGSRIIFVPPIDSVNDCKNQEISVIETATGIVRKKLNPANFSEKLKNRPEWFSSFCWMETVFSPDGKWLLTVADSLSILWDLNSGKPVHTLFGYSITQEFFYTFCEFEGWLHHAEFSADSRFVLLRTSNYQTILWETATGRKLYTRLQLKGDDYLVYDEHYRFDGTPGAMEKLYFVCGLETTELGQMKDALYVPGLAEKIINGEEINYKKLSDLDFCNALPLLELQKEDSSGRELRIQQRRWPLKQLDIKVGGKTVRSIPAEKLGFKDNLASLQISNAGMEKYLLAGIDNEVELQALSMDKGSEFRSQSVKFSLPGPKTRPQPKLFMLLIGVNDYKDDELDLNYPVQDARALGNALEQSAAKLLGKENVEAYHVQSRLPGQQVYTTPERTGVMKALEEIGRKARTQDVLFIFFAGHGVMQASGEKAFTFLTADASKLNQTGISTKDLKEWLSPEGPFSMMPNKTILVYDACNSGQAAKELVSVLTRDNDATERRRQIEDLGDKSGLFILSASAPDKPAYEVQGLGQGLLTYSMLYTLKNNPLILDENVEGNGFLNLQKWFLETEREQNRLMSSLGLKQKAQPYGSANIRIGMVDEEVRNGIKLMEEKPLVYCASARNENEEDPLDLKNRVNYFLENGHTRGIQSDVAFVPSETPQTNVVKLVYRRSGEKVSCRILIFRNKQKIHEQSLETPEEDLVKSIVKELERVCK